MFEHKPTIDGNDIPLDAAFNAHRNTSHVPERRAEQEREQYVNTLTADYESFIKYATTDEKRETLATEFERYKEGYRSRLLAYLHAHSRCVSVMITGASNFPTERNRKRNDVADRRLQELLSYRDNALAAILRKLTPELQPIKSADSDAVERLEEKLFEAEAKQERMKAINAGYRKGTLLELGLSPETIDKIEKMVAEAYSWEKQPYPSYMLKNNNAEIRRLKARIAEVSEMQSSEHKEEEFGGVKRIENPELGRIQLVFPGKPDTGTIAKLKAAGFRWAPSEGAWQRHLNAAGRYAADALLKELGKKE